MSQLLKKFALLTACAVLALCFAMRPAHAQTVADNGIGEHLLFAYWSAENYTDTWVAIHSPLGVRNSGETRNVVRVVIRDEMGDAAADFKICLMPGDSWTAALGMGNLVVRNAGGCDDKVAQASSDRSNTPVATPSMGEMVSLGGATGGYLEAWLAPAGGLVDDTVGCSPVGTTDDATDAPAPCGTGGVLGGPDADLSPDNATPRVISGIATLVSPMSGFSSSYNAVALTGCGNRATVGDTAVPIAPTYDDGNGCWHFLAAADTATPNLAASVAGEGITAALMAENMDLLTGRWTAINDDNIMSHTKVVLTLPVNHLSYKGKNAPHAVPTADNAADISVIEDVEGTDPVSIYAFDEAGLLALNAHEIMLDMNVNMCRFMAAGMDMGDDMDMSMMPMLSCNGMDVGELDGIAGSFRIFNNVADNVALGQADGSYTIAAGTFSDGTELTGIGSNDAAGMLTDSDAATAGSQVPQVAAEPLNAIGLVFSYFMGTDGQQYDQVTPIQSIDSTGSIANDGTITQGNL